MGGPGFTIAGIDHVVLRVRDLPKALEFYCGTLGCTVEREQRALGLTQLRAGRSLIDLVTVDGPLGARAPAGALGPNLEHFCLSITPFEERSLRAHLEARGVAAGATEARYGAEGEGPSLYLEDPEGNRIELKGVIDAGVT
jgi:glyoxylase I family protein